MIRRISLTLLLALGVLLLTLWANHYEVTQWSSKVIYNDEEKSAHVLAGVIALFLALAAFPSRLLTVGSGFMIGAALSNALVSPRIWDEGVPDYLHSFDQVLQIGGDNFGAADAYLPAGETAHFFSLGVWNLADCFNTFGLGLMLFGLFYAYRQLTARTRVCR